MKQLFSVKSGQFNYLIVLEIALGTTASIIIANFFGLKYGAVAGITTMLTIQNTFEDTLVTAIKRFIAFAVMIFLCWVIFR